MIVIKKSLLLVFCMLSTLAYAQDQKFKVSIQSGWLTGGDIYSQKKEAANPKDSWGGYNIGVDINYFVSNRIFVGVHAGYGDILYRVNIIDPLSDTYYRDQSIECGSMEINNIGVSVGYCLPISALVNASGQIGFAQFIQMDSYPKIEYVPDESFSIGFREKIQSEFTSNLISASFPVKFSIGVTPFKESNINLAKNIEIAYAVGWYIEPDFGFFTGIYHGPQLSVLF